MIHVFQARGRGKMCAPTPPWACSWQSCARPPGTSWRWKPVTAPAAGTRALSLQHWTMTAVSQTLWGWGGSFTLPLGSAFCSGEKASSSLLRPIVRRHNPAHQVAPREERRREEALLHWLPRDSGHRGRGAALHHSQEAQGKEVEEAQRWGENVNWGRFLENIEQTQEECSCVQTKCELRFSPSHLCSLKI